MTDNPIISYQAHGGMFRAATITDTQHLFAQRFAATASYPLSGIQLKFETSGDSVSSVPISVEIQGMDGDGKPDGNTLWSSSGNITLASYSSKEVWFDGTPYQLTFQQYYFIIVTGTTDRRLYLLGNDITYYGNEIRTSTDGGSSWSDYNGWALSYLTRGQLIAPVVETTSAVYKAISIYHYVNWLVTLKQRIISGEKRLGICYSTENEAPTIEDDSDYDEDYYYNDDTESDYQRVTAGQTYYVRAFCYLTDYPPATYPDAIGYGEVIEVVTPSLEPVVTTQAATVPVAVANPAYYEWATGNGTIVSGEKITDRGFEIVVNFSGDLYDNIQHSIAGFEGTASWDSTAWAYVGTLTKTETEDIGFGGYFEAGAYDMELGSFPAIFDKLFAGETYTYRAFATNDIGTGYGDYVEFTMDIWTPEDGDDSVNDDISDGDPCVPIIPIDPGIGDIGDIGDTIPDFDFPPFDPFEDSPYPDWDFDYPPWEWDFPEIPPWVYWDFPDLPPLPPWILPDLPDWEIPDYPDMSFVGDFYYRKPYKKKDLDELRKKCIIYNKNSVEFALVLRHNMTVLKGFFNMMTDYMGTEEFNDFTDLIPPQRLKELNLDPLEPTDFRDMINGFIRNTVDNNIAVNRNFNLIQEGLSDYETGSDDAHFRNIVSNMKQLKQDNPDVERMKTLIDNLNYEVAMNFNNIMHNLSVVRAKLL